MRFIWLAILAFFYNGSLSYGAAAPECDALLKLMSTEVATESSLKPEEINFEYYLNPRATETLVLIHGMDSALQTFTPVIEELKTHFSVLVYDQRGHGRSKDRGFNYASKLLAQDLLSLVNHLNISKFHVLGHSFGARTAMRFAQLYQDRIESIIIEDMEMIKRQEFDVDQMINTARKIATFPQDFASKQDLIADFQKLYGPKAVPPSTRIRENSDGTVTLLFKPYVGYLYGRQAVMEDFSEALTQVTAPILVVGAQAGRSAISENGYAHFRTLVPSAQIVEIPNSLHNIHGTQPRAFLDAVILFINEVSQ